MEGVGSWIIVDSLGRVTMDSSQVVRKPLVFALYEKADEIRHKIEDVIGEDMFVVKSGMR